MTDQLRWDYLSCYGHPHLKTPNIDNLASQSVIFNNAHSNVPVCSPSRASFMTGIHPITSKFWGFGNALKNEVFMNSKSIPEFLKENSISSYQIDSELLLSKVLNKTREYLFLNNNPNHKHLLFSNWIPTEILQLKG